MATHVDRFQLAGRTALVTGASKGIGYAIAVALAEAGAEVMLSSRKQDAVDAAAREIADSTGATVHAVAAHMGDGAQIDALAAAAREQMGGVDILVNNAATNPVFGPLLQAEEAAFDKIMAVNVKGPFALCKQLQPSMAERGRGSVINIASVGGISPEPMLGLYSVSKAALISMTKVMAKEWSAAGIRANVICPGLVKTKFSQALWQNDAVLNEALRDVPLARAAEPDEIAGIALYLAGDAASYATGGVFTVDGGHTI